MEMPKELLEQALEIVEIARNSGGKVKKGVNEVTKMVERGLAKLVILAGDVNPPEIVMHLDPLCEEKDIPCFKGSTKDEIGNACGIEVPCTAVALIEVGEAKKRFKELETRVKSLKK